MTATKEKDADRTRALAERTEASISQPTAYRVYYVLSGTREVPFDRDPKDDPARRRFQVNSFSDTLLSASVFRTRMALAVVLEKLLARGVLTKEDVDDILLAAVDYHEPVQKPAAGPRPWEAGV